MPNNRMLRFELFIGVWNTTGEVLETDSASSGTLRATDTYRWLPGKHFIVHEVDARFDDKPTRSMEVMGYDGSSKKYFAHSFDDQGSAESYNIALVGRRWTIASPMVRFQGSFNAQKDRLSGTWEMKSKKGIWQPWIRLQLLRA